MKYLSLIEIKNNILNGLKGAWSKLEGTFVYDIASMCSLGISELYDYMSWWGNQAFIDTATEDIYVDKHAEVFGVDRLSNSKAIGEVTITGKIGAKIPRGFILISRNAIKYATQDNLYLDSVGKGIIKIECLTPGVIGNCAIGDITSFEIINSDVYSVVNEISCEGGYETESNQSLIERAKIKIRQPAHSGNINDYYQWAKSVNGVGKVEVIPLWNGAGTVKVIVSDINNDIASHELIEDVKNYIEDNRRPIGADVSVISFSSFLLNITSEVILSVGYDINVVREKIIADLKIALLTDKLSYRTSENKTIISYSKINNLILSVEGVLDVVNLKLNGISSNVEVDVEFLVRLNEVIVNGITDKED